jgi:hypothetical protein
MILQIAEGAAATSFVPMPRWASLTLRPFPPAGAATTLTLHLVVFPQIPSVVVLYNPYS